MKEEEILFEKFNIIECLKKDDNSSVYIATNINSKKRVILKILNTINLVDTSILERLIIIISSHPLNILKATISEVLSGGTNLQMRKRKN